MRQIKFLNSKIKQLRRISFQIPIQLNFSKHKHGKSTGAISIQSTSKHSRSRLTGSERKLSCQYLAFPLNSLILQRKDLTWRINHRIISLHQTFKQTVNWKTCVIRLMPNLILSSYNMCTRNSTTIS